VGDRRLSVSLRQPAPIPLEVDFTCDAGDVLAIFGPSGSGKTTILRSIAGLYQPDHALVRAGGETWSDTGGRVFAPPHRRAVGFVFQEYALFPHLSAAGNVITALGHRPRSERRARASELLSLVHLPDQQDRRPRELSGGERQRVALARAFLADAPILILDEATSSLDSESEQMIQDGLRRLRSGRTTFVIAHRLSTIRSADQILVLEHGQIVERGTHEELLELGGRYRQLYDKQYNFEYNRFINPGEDFTPDLPKADVPAARTPTALRVE
jgi:ABC-type multidrug transport system fused ATPase/permease subunit